MNPKERIYQSFPGSDLRSLRKLERQGRNGIAARLTFSHFRMWSWRPGFGIAARWFDKAKAEKVSHTITIMNRISASAAIVATLALGTRVIVPSDRSGTTAAQSVLASDISQQHQNVNGDINIEGKGNSISDGRMANQANTQDQSSNFEFSAWPVGNSISLNNSWSRSYSDLNIRLVSIEKTAIDKISLVFEADVGPKQYFGKFDFRNSPEHPKFLFVYDDAYINIGQTKSRYAEGMYLIDGSGKKYKAINGIEGVEVEPFNSNAFRAILPWSKTTKFSISFPIPDGDLTSLKFVSPYLSGHQDEWYVDII